MGNRCQCFVYLAHPTNNSMLDLRYKHVVSVLFTSFLLKHGETTTMKGTKELGEKWVGNALEFETISWLLKVFFAFAFETLRLQEPNIRKLTDYVALNCNKCSVVWNCKSLNVSKFLKDSSHATIKTTRYLWILCFEIFCTTEANKNNFGRETKILLK